MIGSKMAGLSLLSIGGVGFIPFFTSGESGKKWDVRPDGSEFSVINFAGGATSSGVNRSLKGGWALLNKKKSDERDLFNNGVVDIALPTKVLESSYGKVDISNKELKILYCRKDSREGMDLVEATNSKGKVYCKDLTEDWLLGYFDGKYYSALFVVLKGNIFKNGGSSFEKIDIQNLSGAYETKVNNDLINILKLATKAQRSFLTDAHYVNAQDNYSLSNINLKWCGADKKMCFLWGQVFIKAIEKEQNSINCNRQNSLEGCKIKIVDVSSRDTLKPFLSL